MNREILFRGFHPDPDGKEKIVIDGETIKGYWILFGIRVSPVSGFMEFYQLLRNENQELDVIPSTVGQYTGLTDKNGVKIFEGDIVMWCDKNFVLNGHYTYGFNGYRYGDELIVRCLESGFMLCKKHDGMPDIPNANSKIDNYAFWNDHRFFEVVGNIHDNPDLLEKTHDGGEA